MLTQGIHIHAEKKSIQNIDIIDECIFTLSITLHILRNIQMTYKQIVFANIQIAYIFRVNDFSATLNFKQFPHIFGLHFNKRRNNNEN